MGRLLKRAETIRYAADYEGEMVQLTDANGIVEQAAFFVASIRRSLSPKASDDIGFAP